MSKSLIHVSIDAGRIMMKSEILEHIFKIYEEYARKENDEVARAIYRLHQMVKSMPCRVQDKQHKEPK